MPNLDLPQTERAKERRAKATADIAGALAKARAQEESGEAPPPTEEPSKVAELAPEEPSKTTAPPPEEPPAPRMNLDELVAELAKLRSEVERTQAGPPYGHDPRVEQAIAELRNIKDRQAKEEDERIARDISVLESARREAIEAQDFLRYDQILRRQNELERERDRRHLDREQQARPQYQPPAQPDPEIVAAERAFRSQHDVTETEYAALVAVDRLRMQDPKYAHVPYTERWKGSLDAIRGAQPSAAPQRPKMKAPALRGAAEAPGDTEDQDLSTDAKQMLSKFRHYGKDWERRLKEKAEKNPTRYRQLIAGLKGAR